MWFVLSFDANVLALLGKKRGTVRPIDVFLGFWVSFGLLDPPLSLVLLKIFFI